MHIPQTYELHGIHGSIRDHTISVICHATLVNAPRLIQAFRLVPD